MRNFIIYLAVALCSIFTQISAQEKQSFEQKAKEIAQKIEQISAQEKENLKKQVEEVNKLWDKNEITKQQADEQKIELATKSAKSIENQVAQQQNLLNQLVKDKVDGKLYANDSEDKKNKFVFKVDFKKDSTRKSEKRTTSQFVFAIGVNNLVTNNQLDKSDFGYLRSRFYEWGLTYNTRLSKTSNIAHIKYGYSVQYNDLQASENRVFQKNGNQTILVNSPIALRHSRLRNVNLVFPVHFELDFSKTKTINDAKVYQSHQGFRLGLGGFAGFNLKTKQILRYNDPFGNTVRQKTKGDFNVNDFVYGISSYIGFGETTLYAKYDLNEVFKNNDVKQNNVSLGMRFDFN